MGVSATMPSSTRNSAGRRRGRQRSGSAGSAEQLLPRWIVRAVATVLVVVSVVPVLYMIVLSLTPNQAVALGTIDLAKLTWSNYTSMWSAAPLAAGLVHTLVIAGASALLSVAFGLLAAYPLTRFKFRGRGPFMTVLIGVQTVPGTTLVLPLFAVLSWIQTTISAQLIGSYWAIIVTYMTFGVPLSTWLLVAYLRTIPRDLEEAALVDGCTRFGALRRIVLPITVPALVVAFVFAFLVGWNDVLFASVFTNSSTQTLAIVVQRFANNSAAALPVYGELMSAAVVSSAPVVLLYLAFQRYLVNGLSAGSLTGV
jgi:multiple sugar transport system permease protein